MSLKEQLATLSPSLCARFGLARLAVFGSVARDDYTEAVERKFEIIENQHRVAKQRHTQHSKPSATFRKSPIAPRGLRGAAALPAALLRILVSPGERCSIIHSATDFLKDIARLGSLGSSLRLGRVFAGRRRRFILKESLTTHNVSSQSSSSVALTGSVHNSQPLAISH